MARSFLASAGLSIGFAADRKSSDAPDTKIAVRLHHAGPTNVMIDLAVAMKQNPNLKVQLNGGYYDLATPYFAAVYELHQLPIQASLQENIDMHFYTSGHMVYAHEPDLKALHANVATFIERTKNAGH